MTEHVSQNGALQAMSDALLAITSELTVERALQKMVDAARDLVNARYAALGVPDGEGGLPSFTDEDRRLIEMLAAHAAVSIENARLYERSRELSVIEERNRLARDLHDSVTQTLFSVALTAEAAVTLVDRDAAAAKTQLEEL